MVDTSPGFEMDVSMAVNRGGYLVVVVNGIEFNFQGIVADGIEIGEFSIRDVIEAVCAADTMAEDDGLTDDVLDRLMEKPNEEGGL